ncbi:hypothetical protein THAOC_23455 [Thalassiosira oceanica]|uniref:Uncharacterized protein n=1 Tax=Thalassiosira oceanica TaxID=159749 RepID=K0SDB4_THAOC|nr:hypothetical protein THAOC_23455 [Thalassiosira oceanica]|eukprot:EJK56622.1 hypothetical protein THAOC_23455 [Thalassiosira oceanica]
MRCTARRAQSEKKLSPAAGRVAARYGQSVERDDAVVREGGGTIRWTMGSWREGRRDGSALASAMRTMKAMKARRPRLSRAAAAGTGATARLLSRGKTRQGFVGKGRGTMPPWRFGEGYGRHSKESLRLD